MLVVQARRSSRPNGGEYRCGIDGVIDADGVSCAQLTQRGTRLRRNTFHLPPDLPRAVWLVTRLEATGYGDLPRRTQHAWRAGRGIIEPGSSDEVDGADAILYSGLTSLDEVFGKRTGTGSATTYPWPRSSPSPSKPQPRNTPRRQQRSGSARANCGGPSVRRPLRHRVPAHRPGRRGLRLLRERTRRTTWTTRRRRGRDTSLRSLWRADWSVSP
jgi:hypothetical protein